MVEGELAEDSKYSRITGLIYIFNLIVGTGALTLPAAFHDAGWALSSAVLILLAFMSFLTATFVIETMASANALGRWRRLQRLKRPGGRTGSNSENQYVDKNIQVVGFQGAFAPTFYFNCEHFLLHCKTKIKNKKVGGFNKKKNFGDF